MRTDREAGTRPHLNTRTEAPTSRATSAFTRSRSQWLALSGLVGALFYFLHVIVGKLYYPGYSSMSQAISDLTAATAPSRDIAAGLSSTYSLFTVAACTLLCVFFEGKGNRSFRTGIYLFAAMQWVSAIGYSLFSLSDSGYAGTFRDVMHMIVTMAVVLLSIISMILIAVGCMKRPPTRRFGLFTIAMLALMALGSMGTGAVPPAYFGIAERISVYSVIIYTAALSWFTFGYSEHNTRATKETSGMKS